ncbi:hypothetical protein PGT21_034909 [Puccinia graminis f. sp. tritici]|nr:hypothetical protein PGT21_034909 [Puccinia graminis f. sp. tritici]
MHGDNAAVNAYGHVELGSDLTLLVADPGPDALEGDTSILTDESAQVAQMRRDRLGVGGLTAAELALDQSDAEDSPPVTGSGAPPATPTSALTSAAIPGAPTTPKPPATSQPTARRRGKTEPVKADDTNSHALILMLQKSQARQEETRRDDLLLAEKRSDVKEGARLEAMRQAKHDREQAEAQMKIEQTKAQAWADAAAADRRARDEDRKEERKADLERRAEEKQASQIFQAAMLGMLARLGGNLGPTAPGGTPGPSGPGGSS